MDQSMDMLTSIANKVSPLVGPDAVLFAWGGRRRAPLGFRGRIFLFFFLLLFRSSI